jgi:DNA-binding beta-propeller fold protein YncE
MAPNGKLLFATNTPDNRLEIFKVTSDGLQPIGSVVVGLEPVAVAARTQNEVWVVNHLSDSISIVDVSDANNARVVRTLAVGDEPRDIVFGGADHSRAFITTAHRGQNAANGYGDSADLDPPSLVEWAIYHKAPAGRADVWVFDANNLGSNAGGTRLTKLTLFADTPRALAVSADGKTVYAAAYFSGNQTTVVSPDAVRTIYGLAPTAQIITWPGMPFPQPITGLIVKYTGGKWLDFYGNDFSKFVTISLPDNDVFAIDATANPPAAIATGVYAHVGTTLFNAAVNPVTGKVYVSNTDAHNEVRFEGHNPGVSSVRGNIVDSRITVIDPSSGSVTPVNLNSHLTHSFDGAGDASLSRAFPQDLTVSHDGTKLYVVAQGSGKLAIYNTAALEAGSAAPTAGNQVSLSAGGPTGARRDERPRLRAHALRQRHLDGRPLAQRRDRAPRALQPRAGERHRRPPLPL